MNKKDVQQALLDITSDDKQAFDRLFLAYYKKLVQFAAQIVLQIDIAEDVVADVFSKLWSRRKQLVLIADGEAYLYTSVKNGCLDQLKRKNRATVVKETEVTFSVPSERGELRKILVDAVRALPEQRRLVFWLVKEQGKTSLEVAGILGISPRTVENHLYKAVKTLANTISRYLGYDPQHPNGNQKISGFFFF